MPKIAYIEKKFKDASLGTIDRANEIIEEYGAQNMKLTLRQLYYQFVSRGLIANKQSEYKRLGSLISDARLAGLINWYAIEDRTRSLKGNTHWNNPGEIVRAASRGFKLDHWEGQDYRVEVWIEKEALIGVISTICQELDVDYFACKGYVSQSEMWNASQRFDGYVENNQIPVIIHLGDHDPSGMDMTRDIDDRQELFVGPFVEVNRIALNLDQIKKYDPPPNPAKLTDSRAPGYITKYGYDSWELDALEPRVLDQLIRDTVTGYRNEWRYNKVLEKERQYLAVLKRIEENWQTL